MAARRPTVLLTPCAGGELAQALRAGVADVIPKPVDLVWLRFVVRRVLEADRLAAGRAVDDAAKAAARVPGLIGDSASTRRLRESIASAARSECPVLLTGERAVGKRLVARALHRAGARRGGRFVAVDCIDVPERQSEVELFGREGVGPLGAGRPGLIEAAGGGTLFLQELGALGANTQERLLRVLQTGRFRRLEAEADQRADVRVITATHRDPAALVREGRVRADLLRGIAHCTIEVPPLRERRADIPAVAEHFARRSAPAEAPPGFSPAAIERLCTHDWPGNVGELRNVVERAVLLAAGSGEIEPWHLPFVGGSGGGVVGLLEDEPTLDQIERRYLAMLLERHRGNRRRVAEAMGVSERTTYRMLDRYGLR